MIKEKHIIIFMVIFCLSFLTLCSIDRFAGTERPVNVLVVGKEHKPGYYSTDTTCKEQGNWGDADRARVCSTSRVWHSETFQLQVKGDNTVWWVSVNQGQYQRATINETNLVVYTYVGKITGHIYR